jgi:hypothetical protein
MAEEKGRLGTEDVVISPVEEQDLNSIVSLLLSSVARLCEISGNTLCFEQNITEP